MRTSIANNAAPEWTRMRDIALNVEFLWMMICVGGRQWAAVHLFHPPKKWVITRGIPTLEPQILLDMGKPLHQNLNEVSM